MIKLRYLIAAAAVVIAASSGQSSAAYDPEAVHKPNNAALNATSTDNIEVITRDGFADAGDAPPLHFTRSSSACSLNSGNGDGGSQVKSKNNKCWLSNTADPRQFGLTRPGVYTRFLTVTTTAGSGSVTLTGGSFSATNVNDYIVIEGAGPYEQRYIGRITAVADTEHITVSPAPTLSIPTLGPATTPKLTIVVYYGPGGSTAINKAFAAGARLGITASVPDGIYFADAPLVCPAIDYNNADFAAPLCRGSPGAIIMAVADMSGATPVAGVMLNVGGYANGTDFTQYIRGSTIDGDGMTLDCSFIATKGYAQVFSQTTTVRGFNVVNCLTAGYQIGATGAPATTAAISLDHLKYDRKVIVNRITNITSTTVPVVTTARDHGIATGRVVTVVGGTNIPSPGPISFIAKSTGLRTLELHNINGSGWAAFVDNPNNPALLALTYPTNALPHPVFALSSANPSVIQIDGDLTMANGQTWCIYGVGGTGPNGTTSPPTNVPDGCYVISNVTGAGADGPFQFTVPVNAAGFTFTGGGIAFRQDTAVGDMAIYVENASDVQVSNAFGTGVRWGIYSPPPNRGFNGKFAHNHFSNFMEQGWMTAGLVLGGSNSLIGNQVDTPAIFGAIFTSGGNSSTGFGFNGAFPFVCDGCAWLYRLDSGAAADASLSSTGHNVNGQSGSIRTNLLSNALTAGNPPYFGAISNYLQYGGSNAGNMLYTMPDSPQAKPSFTGTPGGYATTSLTAVSAGLGAGGCVITPRYSGKMTFGQVGTIANSTVGDGAFAQLVYGTGTPPVAGAAYGGGVGTIGISQGLSGEPTGGAGMTIVVSVSGTVTVTKNVPYWWDMGVRAVTGGTASYVPTVCTADEP